MTIGWLQIFAKEDSSAKFVQKETFVSKFYAKSGQLYVNMGGAPNRSELDNQQIIDVFENEQICLDGVDYQAYVKKLDTLLGQGKNKNTFPVYQYQINIRRTKSRSFHRFLTNLKSKNYITCTMKKYKKPVTCHYFIVGDKLYFLVYEGLPIGHSLNVSKAAKLKSFINYIKQEIATREKGLPVRQFILKETTTAFFTVETGKRHIFKGTKNDCEDDNRFIHDAIENKQASVSGIDYAVRVREIHTNDPNVLGHEPTVFLQYCVELQTNRIKNKSFNKIWSDLKAKDDLGCNIQKYVAPIVCDYFIVGDKLVLLKNFGDFPDYEGFKHQNLINYIKHQVNAEMGSERRPRK